MIHGPTAISIGNETDVTRDIIFRHGKPYSNLKTIKSLLTFYLLIGRASWLEGI